ncbi:MAG TPA: YbaB/EbfC family nucleoid-associated protein [Firmicutes bacterium]|nr:YbaB/EbfC family nucleoid-associated protein [Bacillota bacterium]
MAYGGRGFGGGMNMQALMKQAQQMQEQLKKAQEELKASEFVGSAGGGMVKVTVSGAKEVLAVSINPQAIDPDDIEMLEDLVTAAVNDALNKAAEKERELMPMAGNLGL